ncbi:MAG: phosphate-starvation-inducible PsiE family protein [Melioribacteraceae bacterium]
MIIKPERYIEFVEYVIYLIIILFLIVGSVLLIYDEITSIIQFTVSENSIQRIIDIIAKTLVLLMIIEIMYTVRISIKLHTLCAEPFLIIGLIASIRRILIISIETSYKYELFQNHMIEIGILVALIFIFVIAIVLLRKYEIRDKRVEI